MSTDAYDPCPCGSGKKYKFCCHAVEADMNKISHQIESGQIRGAIAALEKLETGKTLYPEVAITHANLLVREQDFKGAKGILQKLLQQESNHPIAIASYGLVAVLADGIERARAAVYRAFLHGGAIAANITSNIAMYLAADAMVKRHFLAAREYLALSMRLAPEQKRQDIFIKLLQFDGDRRIPYPYRSVHPLIDCAVGNDHEKTYRRARRFCESGCWAEAHRIFLNLAEQFEGADAAPLWHNAGYVLAWDGQETEAAKALHKAAKLYNDRAQAIECETLAQLLDLYHATGDNVVNIKTTWYPVESVSKLLSVLGGHERIARSPVPLVKDSNATDPVAEFDILDRPETAGTSEANVALDDLPRILSALSVYDRDDKTSLPGRVYLNGYEGDQHQQALEVLKQVENAGIDFAKEQVAADVAPESLPREMVCFERSWRLPPKVTGKQAIAYEVEHWQRTIEDIWPKTPLIALGGATPAGVAGDAAFDIPLTAAIYVLDTHCDMNLYHLPIEQVASALKVDPMSPLEVTDETPMQTITSLGLHRLPLPRLSDKQLSYALNRILLIHHGRLLHDVFTEVLKRPECMNQLDLNRLYTTMSELSRERHDREARFGWIEKGKELAKQAEHTFERGLEWCMREVVARLEDPQDSQLNSLLMHVWNYYVPKIPDIKNYLTDLLKRVDVTPPWDKGTGIITSSDNAGTEGVWTPQSQGGEQASGSKLWLPGQD